MVHLYQSLGKAFVYLWGTLENASPREIPFLGWNTPALVTGAAEELGLVAAPGRGLEAPHILLMRS